MRSIKPLTVFTGAMVLTGNVEAAGEPDHDDAGADGGLYIGAL